MVTVRMCVGSVSATNWRQDWKHASCNQYHQPAHGRAWKGFSDVCKKLTLQLLSLMFSHVLQYRCIVTSTALHDGEVKGADNEMRQAGCAASDIFVHGRCIDALVTMGVLVPGGDSTAVRRTAEFFLKNFDVSCNATTQEPVAGCLQDALHCTPAEPY